MQLYDNVARVALSLSSSDETLKLLCRGHGTQVVDGTLMATVCGVIQRVNKLISVVPVNNRCI